MRVICVSRVQPLGMEINSFVEILFPQLLITAKTLKNYTGAYNRHLFNEIGSLKIHEVSKNMLVNLLAVLPAQTRYQTLMVARVIFREAM